MNDLERYFKNNKGNLIHKWNHYFEIYDRHFKAFRDKEVHVVEIGVSHGGSLKMWQEYFGADAYIYGVDVNPDCVKHEEEKIKIFIGDQEDRSFLKTLVEKIPRIDILIDDGGHRMRQQINTFEVIFPHVSKNGIYLVEDLQTSYSRSFGGGYKRKESFIEYSKNLIDNLNAWHSENKKKLDITEFTKTTFSLNYYDGILVIEKRHKETPYHETSGEPSVKKYKPEKNKNGKQQNLFKKWLKNHG